MIVFCTYSREVWGAERSLLQLIKSSGRLDEVLVVTDIHSTLTPELSTHGIPEQRFRFADHPALKDGSLARAGRWGLLREGVGVLIGGVRLALLLRKRRRQITALVAFSTWQTPETVIAARLLRVPVAVDLHDTFASPTATRAVRRLARLSDLTLVPTQSLADRYGLSQDVSVVPRPVAEPPCDVSSTAPAAVVGVFGQIVEHKRVLEIAEAFSISVTDPSARLVVCGLSDTPSEYEQRILEFAEADPRINVLRRRPDVSHEMQACSVIVNFSDHEAFGRTLAEGAMLGCLPVARAGTGGEDVVRTLGWGQVIQEFTGLGAALAEALAKARGADRLEISEAARDAFEATNVAADYFAQVHALRASALR